MIPTAKQIEAAKAVLAIEAEMEAITDAFLSFEAYDRWNAAQDRLDAANEALLTECGHPAGMAGSPGVILATTALSIARNSRGLSDDEALQPS